MGVGPLLGICTDTDLVRCIVSVDKATRTFDLILKFNSDI